MINIIKRRLFIGIFLTAVIMATIGGSVHVYNLLSFVIPVLFVISMFVLQLVTQSTVYGTSQ